MQPSVTRQLFGVLSDGQPVTRYTLDNGAGMQLAVLDYGCIIQSWSVPGDGTVRESMVLGYERLQDYQQDRAYMGALVGRCANRIANGRFELDAQTVQLSQNEGQHHLHGGVNGFHTRLWQATASSDAQAARLTLWRMSPAGEEGYPANLVVMVIYALSADGELLCRYQAAADAATPVSISQHSYFNLAGKGDVLGHELCIRADYFLPVRPDLIPTGEVRAVERSAFDLRRPRAIGSTLRLADEQLRLAGGYDHNFVLAPTVGPQVSLRDPVSGRQLDIETDCPGLQFYSGNYLGQAASAPAGAFGRHAGLCLEPQQFPDAPNHPAFPLLVCRPGQPCSMTTRYILNHWRSP